MKKRIAALDMLLVLVIIFLPGFSASAQAIPENDLKPVDHVGQVPEVLTDIIENNKFRDITAFGTRVLKVENFVAEDETPMQCVRMMDIQGQELAQYTYRYSRNYFAKALTATEDGGFLFGLGFSDYYESEKGAWASEDGFASRIIKCDPIGNVQFDTALVSLEGSALDYCFEKNGKFYFFGDIQTPETKKLGVHSCTDIYMTVLDEKGTVLNTKCIAGTDYDDLIAAESTDDGFLLSIRSQSDDGDFAGSNSKGYMVDWMFCINDDLEITGKEMKSGRDYFDIRLGEKDGKPIYRTNTIFRFFNSGTPTAFIDYGDFYLIVSENNTGIYENPPLAISSIWFYTETVYSGYDKSGRLLFRTAVDSSPDYSMWVESTIKQ
ncbi:MAG: hypothetical protein E7324_01215 [Clostridiales bacterium]|nr:hypothetical protein [Clostridiales bacterium]